MSFLSRLGLGGSKEPLEHPAPLLEEFIAEVRMGFESIWTSVLNWQVGEGAKDPERYRLARERIDKIAFDPRHLEFAGAAKMRAMDAAEPVILAAMAGVTRRHPQTAPTEMPRVKFCLWVTAGAAAALALDGYVDRADQKAMLWPFAVSGSVAKKL